MAPNREGLIHKEREEYERGDFGKFTPLYDTKEWKIAKTEENMGSQSLVKFTEIIVPSCCLEFWFFKKTTGILIVVC